MNRSAQIIMLNKKQSSRTKLSTCTLLLPLAFLVLVTINAYAIVENFPVNHAIKHEVFDAHELQSDSIKGRSLIADSTDYIVPDELPTFPGGLAARDQFMRDNFNNDVSRGRGISGEIICSFVVQPSGEVTDVKIVQGVDPVIDNEYKRVVAAMLRHIPGKKNGVAVPVLLVTALRIISSGP